MIRTIVVEDEPFASRRICRLIGLVDPDFELVGTAADGEAALELLGRVPCDLLFTDIRMPVMDGVALIERLSRERPELMLVIVSGFSDFRYLSAALRANAVDYLLKPVSEEDMRGLLARVRARYAERQSQLMLSALASRINKAAPAQARAEAPAGAHRLRLMLLCAGSLPMCENADMCPGALCWGELKLRELAGRCLADAAGAFWEFTGDSAAERIVIYEVAGAADAAAVAGRLHAALLARTKLPVSCIYHGAPVALDGVRHALHALRGALEEHLRVGRSLLLCADGIQTHREAPSQARRAQAGALLMRPDPAVAAALADELEREAMPQREIFELFRQALARLAAEQALDDAGRRTLENALEESFSAALSLGELLGDISGLCAPPPARAQGDGSDVVRQIARYLDQNYAQYITNQMLSERFGYVPSYLSRLFRDEEGISPVEYLTRVRMERAKRLLTRQPETLIKDVAMSVGFKNQYHFSRTFKKYAGVWPTDYRARET